MDETRVEKCFRFIFILIIPKTVDYGLISYPSVYVCKSRHDLILLLGSK